MKMILLAAAALVATPALAQDMAAPAPEAPMAAPMTDDTPSPPGTTGGYGPSGPALNGPFAPGTIVRFVPAPSPDQAYPAPAPLKSYPVCKRGQTDNCRERGG